jgi:hypothetical protein
MAITGLKFASIVNDVVSGMSGVVSHSVSDYFVKMMIKSRSGKLTYEVSAEYNPKSGGWSYYSPYPGTGALITLRREVDSLIRSKA